MAVVFDRTNGLQKVDTHYCPGCTHGIIHRLVAEVLEELDVLGNAIGVVPVGCSVLAYNYFNCDTQEASHGRAPAVATGVKRTNPDKIVFTYQGDGDLASIGTAEIVHAAARGEKITTIFVNNTTYGMTGGQMAPTTLVGQKATTAQNGRNPETQGYPIRVSELLATLTGAVFVERVAVDSPANVRKAKKAIKRAFEVQQAGKGFGIVEVLSTCPTNWGLTPVDALQWLRDNMMPYYPVQNFRDDLKNEEVK
ncbi:MAG: 2-oxoglutarate oxidoreductase [Clostridioides sp.]|jgi:2-oxoglutarate ferredoxin oxidoreductase subunit beta|nr:2-oxoglutarate oxidoreductase [Clostridioides sp.]